MTKYRFYNDPTKRPQDAHEDSPQQSEPYVASEDLVRAVNLAIHLRRPLLIEGEAGCGKTRLAYALAYELGYPLYRWDVHSTSKAQDGLYSYDAIMRLHDVQVKQLGGKTATRDPNDPKQYRELGALGKAFNLRDRPAVVLIDEIDKADIDFPNDLLSVLDEPWRFHIPETGELVEAKKNNIPIVIITSNKEKGNLPAPFLRRCLYYFLHFPNDADLLQYIIERHYQNQTGTELPSQDLTEATVSRFLDIRKDSSLFKPPGTSELLDWLDTLHRFEGVDAILESESPIPYPEVLFKLRVDWLKYKAA